MSGKPAARLGDSTACPKSGHKNTTIVSGSPDVLFNGMPAARQGDKTSCGSEIVGQVIPNVLINGKPAVVMGSIGAHGDVVTGGSGDIFIGNNIIIGSGVSFGDSSESVRSGVAASTALVAAAIPAKSLMAGGQASALVSRASDGLAQKHDYDDEEDEDEEEEVSSRQHITLRIGVFFDGTGNNMENTLATEQCRTEDKSQHPQEVLDNIQQLCNEYGYKDTTGDGVFNFIPDTSYGNALSNVAKLKGSYRDDSALPLDPTTEHVTFALYVDGIGTTAGIKDNFWGLASGERATGVVTRVNQSGAMLDSNIALFARQNDQIVIDRIEFDVFGFSRGAAAARHFVNEVNKPGAGAVGKAMANIQPWLNESFEWGQATGVNFVGLFDTVAGIMSPSRGDFDPGNQANNGVNLYLPPGCAKKVVHITAADERRHNFSLNRVHESHFEVEVPGVHSDIGGGYHPITQESLLVDKPRVVYRGQVSSSLSATQQWRDRNEARHNLERQGLPGEGVLEPRERRVSSPNGPTRNRPHTILYLGMRRRVHGDLSKVSLTVMHELAKSAGVELRDLLEEDTVFPSDLKPIAKKIIRSALAGQSAKLSDGEIKLLTAKYIHMSANWTTTKGVLVNRPRESGRAVYLDRPQKGYPE